MAANHATSPEKGTSSQNTADAVSAAATTEPTHRYAAHLPSRICVDESGPIRSSSNRPVLRSRTSDNAANVSARCWSRSASAAGVK